MGHDLFQMMVDFVQKESVEPKNVPSPHKVNLIKSLPQQLDDTRVSLLHGVVILEMASFCCCEKSFKYFFILDDQAFHPEWCQLLPYTWKFWQ